jgi:hypothetical protein
MSAPNAWLAVSAAIDPTNPAMSNPFRTVVGVYLVMIPSSLNVTGRTVR